MRRIAPFLMLLATACGSSPAAPQIDITDARARAMVPGQTSTAVYLTIRNSGGEDRLTSVAVQGAQASLHSSSMDDGIMRMRPVEGVDVPANNTIALEPGGMHVMVTGVARPIAEGERLPVTLRFDRAGSKSVEAIAVADPAAAAHGDRR